MSQADFLSKREDRITQWMALSSNLIELQKNHLHTLISNAWSRWETSLAPVTESELKIPGPLDWGSYLLDLGQRSILFWDTLRQRGDNTLDHEAAGRPILLKFAYELLLDGTTLPRPVNYSLLRILPLPDHPIDTTLAPIIIIDPRGGHGAGISGFKDDSEVGESLRAGHPTYFVTFSYSPEPGQTLLDIASAEARFIECVRALHPQSDKPVVIGNCQAGWALMGLAAMRPELPGLVIINGAPLSYWAGVTGRNPMRYSGGLYGGAWVTRLGSDLGNGRFDGNWLVNNFERLNPSNALWEKYYQLFANVDTEAERFLDFERWWGSPTLLNSEEIETIVDELFIGNRLSGANRSKPGSIDLSNIKAPVVVFCSSGDNIVPPQQALDWIADVYPDDSALEAAGNTIIYLTHAAIGHLGIFVSADVARREHHELIGAVEAIKALPPGLFEMIIENEPDQAADATASPRYQVYFEPRSIADILRQDADGRDDEKAMALVDKVSDVNSKLYELWVRPWLGQLVNEPFAEVMRLCHPFRLQRVCINSSNPLTIGLQSTASHIRQHRQSVAPDNPLLTWQQLVSDNIVNYLDFWRDCRDALNESAFNWIYGSLALGSQAPAADTPSLQQIEQHLPYLEPTLTEGGPMEASIRILLLLSEAAERIDKRQLEKLIQLYHETSELGLQLPDSESLRSLINQQNLLVTFLREASISSLPALLPDMTQRQHVLDEISSLLPDWYRADGKLGETWRSLYRSLALPMADFDKRPRKNGTIPALITTN